jgi:hypothetical protein
MTADNIVRRLIGAVKNGVLWGATWCALAFVTVLGLRTIGLVVPPEIGVLDALGMAIRIGFAGGIAGGVFALFISYFYRGRRLSDLNWVRFGLGGSVVAVLFLLAFFAIGNMATGDPFPALDDILSDLIIGAVFGGIAAGASLWVAQRAETPSIGGAERYDSLAAGEVFPGTAETRQRADARTRR